MVSTAVSLRLLLRTTRAWCPPAALLSPRPSSAQRGEPTAASGGAQQGWQRGDKCGEGLGGKERRGGLQIPNFGVLSDSSCCGLPAVRIWKGAARVLLDSSPTWLPQS